MRSRTSTIKSLVAVIAVSALFVPLAACGGAASADEHNNPDAKTIVVGENTKNNKPYNYLNEDGEIDGYESALLKEIDKKLPQYKFQYKSLDWANLLVSLDTGKIDVAASSLAMNDERKQKYAYTEQSDLVLSQKVVVSKKNNSVKSLKDLAGKTALVWQGVDVTSVFENYNKEHPGNPIKLKYGDWAWEQYVASIDKGTAAGGALDVGFVKALNDDYGDKLKTVGDPVLETKSHFLVNKKKAQVAKDFDEAIKELKADGTVNKLSKQYLGYAYKEPGPNAR